jgi:hypothetical protein
MRRVIARAPRPAVSRTASTPPGVDYPITHLVLAWPPDQAHAARAELVRVAQRLAKLAVPWSVALPRNRRAATAHEEVEVDTAVGLSHVLPE